MAIQRKASWKVFCYSFFDVLIERLCPDYPFPDEERKNLGTYSAYRSIIDAAHEEAYGELADQLTAYVKEYEPWMLDPDTSIFTSMGGTKSQIGLIAETKPQVLPHRKVSFLFNECGRRIQSTIPLKDFLDRAIFSLDEVISADGYYEAREDILDAITKTKELDDPFQVDCELDEQQEQMYQLLYHLMIPAAKERDNLPITLASMIYGDTDVIRIDQIDTATETLLTWRPLGLLGKMENPDSHCHIDGKLVGMRKKSPTVYHLHFDNGIVIGLNMNLRSYLKQPNDYITVFFERGPFLPEWEKKMDDRNTVTILK